ncbi:MAG TPA: hypothetical protein VFF14_03190 [Candidatus Deferrimicrobium sp.]|nr:hypothetical protein [Candidatus Deferrimicrobium sp.]
MNISQQEALDFLKEFEVTSRSYFLRKGMVDSELPEALLQAQWQLLSCILQSKLTPASRQGNFRQKTRHAY